MFANKLLLFPKQLKENNEKIVLNNGVKIPILSFVFPNKVQSIHAGYFYSIRFPHNDYSCTGYDSQ